MDWVSELTTWSTLRLKRLTVCQLVRKFSIMYGCWKSVTVFIKTRYCLLSWAIWMQYLLISLRSILILSPSTLWSVLHVFHPKFCMYFLFLHACHIPVHLIRLGLIALRILFYRFGGKEFVLSNHVNVLLCLSLSLSAPYFSFWH